ncbi:MULTISPECIES: hypothetical protein [Pseudomonas]|uniref:hypothetical protein n=1 Tax=Pseudomonas TaxID=286 RepID=UPI002271B594|nr:hypothetical protein [Pseudomonas putida]WAC00577.1 hypothetical protein OSW16_13340 [Pseudomonas putida]
MLDQLNGICVSTAKLINWASKLTRERELAKQLIAGRAHNFWPATRFYEARWEDRVQAWLANLPTGEPDHSLKS